MIAYRLNLLFHHLMHLSELKMDLTLKTQLLIKGKFSVLLTIYTMVFVEVETVTQLLLW